MRSIKGSFCGPFPQPKEPFVSKPFFGDYSSNGGNKLDLSSGDEPDKSTTQDQPTQPTQPPADNNDNQSGGTQFDPDQYESPPQEPPKTETPQADGTDTPP
jgi:penicillin-binding protein 1A